MYTYRVRIHYYVFPLLPGDVLSASDVESHATYHCRVANMSNKMKKCPGSWCYICVRIHLCPARNYPGVLGRAVCSSNARSVTSRGGRMSAHRAWGKKSSPPSPRLRTPAAAASVVVIRAAHCLWHIYYSCSMRQHIRNIVYLGHARVLCCKKQGVSPNFRTAKGQPNILNIVKLSTLKFSINSQNNHQSTVHVTKPHQREVAARRST